MIGGRSGWRAFPWDPGARAGEPFSVEHVPAVQGQGRFDLPGQRAGVLYLAEEPEHALAEKLQDLRNQELEDADLSEAGRRYALAPVRLPDSTFEEVTDLCDPATVAQLGIAPDHVAAMSRQTTQGIALRLHQQGLAGFRWWSVFFGEWHNLVLFRDRLADPPSWGQPRPIHMGDADLQLAARMLGIRLR